MKTVIKFKLIILLIMVFQLGFATNKYEKPKPKKRPNIIMILADDLGFTDLGFTGSDLYLTPNIDRLAKQGMYFSHAYSSHPTCQPSRLALQTGKYPARIGCVSHAAIGGVSGGPLEIPKSEVTIGEALKMDGYTTCHIGKWHIGMGENVPKNRGYDYDIASNDFCCPATYFYPYSNPKHKQNNLAAVPDLEDYPVTTILGEAVSNEAAKFIKNQKDKEKPFFLNMAYYDVHTPIEAQKEKVDKYKKLLKSGLMHKNPTYAAMIENLDEGVGKILATLEENGMAENTIVIFMSDNGGESDLGITTNGKLRDGKGYAYEGGVRVPLIVRWPGQVKPNTVNDQRVIGFDLYPTILKMANAKGDEKHNKNVDGLDLTPLLKNPNYKLPNREFHYLNFLSLVHYKLPISHRNRCYESVMKDDWKLIEFFDMRAGLVHYYELYNLKVDPSEKNNLAQSNPAKVDELKKSIATWNKEVNAPAYDYEKFYGNAKSIK